MTDAVKEILSWYSAENPGTKTNMARLLNHGRLGGTGKMVILPVDQGWEHGPLRSFQPNPPAHDPKYHFDLAVEAGVNGYAAPLGFLEAHAADYAGDLPLILKLTNNEVLHSSKNPTQVVTATIDDALRLGCVAIGLTIYPGSSMNMEMYDQARELIRAAKDAGLVAIVWSYPRGENISAEGETALDVIAYGAHIAAQLGANVIKVKPPRELIEDEKARKVVEETGLKFDTLQKRIEYVVQSCFNGKRVVIFSGGEAKEDKEVLAEIEEIAKGGGFGSIMGRNAFKRPMEDGAKILQKVMDVYATQVK